MIYYITRYTGDSKDAGTKAPNDIESICRMSGWREIRFSNPNKDNKFKKLYVNFNNWKKLGKQVKKNDIVLYQHPMYFGTKFANRFIPILKKKGIKFVALIHDLESLRNLTVTTEESKKSHLFGDLIVLKKFNYIIAHNKKMKQFLIEEGINENKIVCLEIFDYLCQTKMVNVKKSNKVSIAGNLDFNKCGYIYEFASHNPDINIELCGGNYNFEKGKSIQNLVYRGSFAPDKITGVLSGSFGIVWDGPSSKSCLGNTGNYLKYNNPHKTSMYLAAGIPVIVWEEAAIADFIKSNNVGIVVKSLENLSSEINKITNEQYERMAKNARKIGEFLRKGYYFKNSIEHIMKYCIGDN